MKTTYIFTMLILGISLTFSQEKQDLKSEKKVSLDKFNKTVENSKYVDKNGDGIDDRLQSKDVKKTKKTSKENNVNDLKNKTDKFIDEDGDGICDFRQNGMGIKYKNKMMMNRYRYGKNK